MVYQRAESLDRRVSEGGRTSLAIFCGVTVLLGVAGWFALRTTPQDYTDTVQTVTVVEGPINARELRHMELPPDLVPLVQPIEIESPLAHEVETVVAEAKQPEVPHISRPGNPYRMYVSPEVFAARYADASLEELKDKKEVLHEKMAAERTRVCSEFLDSGRGEFELVSAADSGESSVPGQPNYGLIQTRRSTPTGDGRLQIDKAQLPWDEYTGVYDQQDEVFWLLSEIRKREAAKTGSSPIESK